METAPLATEPFKSPRKIEEDARILGRQVFEVLMYWVDSGTEEASDVFQVLSEADAGGIDYIADYTRYHPDLKLNEIWPSLITSSDDLLVDADLATEVAIIKAP